jgi:type IV pilus assembly protein PilC
MAVFAYIARDGEGRERRGQAEAESQDSAVRRLKERGWTVTQITRQGGREAWVSPFAGFRRVKLNDLATFCRQFATLQNAGVSMIRALSVLEKQTGNYALKLVIRDLQAEVEGGAMLSRAMTKYPRVFSPLAVGLVRAGEVGGVLDEVLERLALFLEKEVEIRRKVRSAMTYPVLVMVVASGIVIGLVTFIIPRFIDLFVEFKVKMPTMTRITMGVSDFMTGTRRNDEWKVTGHVFPGVVIFIVMVIAFILLLRLAIQTQTGERIYDIVKLKMPVFGQLNHKVALARFARTLSTLLESGVAILQALETVSGTVANSILSDAILQARASIREGDEISAPLERSGMFPPLVVHMVGIGEETGSLSFMLSKIADHYEQEVDAMLASLTAMLEPILIVMLGGIVGFIVISMFMPMIAMIQTLSAQ